MTDPSEITALKSAVRGVVRTAALVEGITARIEALDPRDDLDAALLDEVSRVAAAHGIASAAFRGLVNTMLARRTGQTSPAE